MRASLDRARSLEEAGSWDEALQEYEEAFQRLILGSDAAAAADLFRRIGRVHRERGDPDLAIEAFETSLAIARAAELRDLEAEALNSLGTAQQFRGRLDEAEGCYLQAREVAEQVEDLRLMARVDQNLGILSNIRGDLPKALSRYNSALERHRMLGDELTAARTLNNIGIASVQLEKWSEATACFDEAYALADACNNLALRGIVDLNRADLHLKRQRFEEARECCDASLEVFRRVRSKWWMAEAYKFYGILYRDTGHEERADTHFSLALGLAEATEDRLLEAETHSEWALLYLEQGRTPEALRRLNRAYRIFDDLRATREVAAIERRLQSLQPRYLEAVHTWGDALGSRTPGSRGDFRRVTTNSDALAEACGMSGWERTWLRVGASVHDVGKTAIPSEILHKQGPLSSGEWEIMRSHVLVGEAMVGELGFPGEVPPIVRSHREHWDGGGYPDGLKGDEIPLSARILCITDTFDALTTARPYRPALSHGAALRIVQQDAGRIYDPELVPVFVSLAEKGMVVA